MCTKLNKNKFTILLLWITLLISSCSNPTKPSVSNGISIDAANVQQIIRGFGAANIVGWRPDMTDPEIQIAFDTGTGNIGFTILRLRIPPDSSQWNINVPTAKKAYEMGVKIIATPWTPPASMKTNDNLVGGELKESSYSDFAAYLKSFSNYMASNGAPLYSVSIQNEPDANVTYESCSWNATQFLNFCKNNAGSIGTRVMMPESENFDHSLSDPTLNDPTAASNVSIISGHIYGGDIAPYPLAESKGKEVWMTEHLDGDTSWSAVLATGVEINNVMTAGMNAYVWWYIVRYYGPISEDGSITKRGYVMSQFARFVRPGFYRIESNVPQGSSNFYITAYKASSSSRIVIVVINTGSNPIEHLFNIQNETVNTFTEYTTTESKNCEQGSTFNVTDGNFTCTLEPSSITTFVSN